MHVENEVVELEGGRKTLGRGRVSKQLPGGEIVLLVEYQNGPVKENGVNGVQVEDVLYAARARLKAFQEETTFRCRENACAITHIEEAIMWLNWRTQQRERAGVEGRNIERPDGSDT